MTDQMLGSVPFDSRTNLDDLAYNYVTMELDRISVNPEIMNGQPCIKDTRLTVRRVLKIIALYQNRNELFAEYPDLTEEDIQQVLAFAASYLPDETLENQFAS